jgi:hypothetical protein
MPVGRTARNSGFDRKLEIDKKALQQRELETGEYSKRDTEESRNENGKAIPPRSHKPSHFYILFCFTIQPAIEIKVWRPGFEFWYKQGSQWCVISGFHRVVN